MHLKLQNISSNDNFNYYQLKNNSKVDLVEIYRQMLTYYYFSDFCLLCEFINKNFFISNIAVKYMIKNNIEPRNHSFDEKLTRYFSCHDNIFSNIVNTPELSQFINKSYESNKNIIFHLNLQTEKISKEKYITQTKEAIEIMLNIDKLPFEITYSDEIYEAINMIIIEYFYDINAYSRLYNFYELFEDEITPIQNDLFKIDMSRCAIIQQENENYYPDLSEFKELYGKDYANNLYGIYQYCLNHKQFIHLNERIIDFNEYRLPVEFILLKKLFSTLSYLCISNLQDKENYINNYLQHIENFSFDALIPRIDPTLYNSNIDRNIIMNRVAFVLSNITRQMYSSFNHSISSDLKLKWYLFLKNFLKSNSSFNGMSSNFVNTSYCLQQCCIFNEREFINLSKLNYNLFIDYIVEDFKSANIEYLSNNHDIIKQCQNSKLLTKLRTHLLDTKLKLENFIEDLFDFEKNEKQQLRKFVLQLNNNPNQYALTIPCSALDIFKLAYELKTYFIEYGNANNIVNNIIKIIESKSYYPSIQKVLDIKHITNIDDVASLYSIYNKIILEEEYLKQELFELEYSDIFEKAKAEIEQFKKDFYNNEKFKRDECYNSFKERLLKNISSNARKELVWKKWNNIIQSYKEKEIIECVSTNEYIYSKLINQDMELTPLLVCYIKSVEQFLCSYIHFMTNNKLISSNNTFKNDWEKHTYGIDLENYISENIHKRHLSKITQNIFDDWTQKSEYWRTKARNGNLHKDNINYKSDLNNFINGCIDLFLKTIDIAIILTD